MNRFRKFKIVLYIVGIFLAGVITGLFVSFQIARHMMPNEARITDHWSGDLRSRLNLSPEQMETVKPIIRKTLSDFKSTLGNDALAALSNCNAQILVALTPEQKLKFEQLEKEQREFIQRKLGRLKPPAPQPVQ